MDTSDKDKAEEAQLADLAKRMLAMPHKPRVESKIGKAKSSPRQSPAKRTTGKGRARVGKSKR